MPFINTKVNFPLKKEDMDLLNNKYCDAITLLGKSEAHLMLDFEDNRNMYFARENGFKMAIVEIKVFGKVHGQDDMTAEVTKILSDNFGIEPNNIYVKYEECFNWGMGGQNF